MFHHTTVSLDVMLHAPQYFHLAERVLTKLSSLQGQNGDANMTMTLDILY